MLIKNCESLDLSNLLHTALENIDYPSKQIHNYVFLIEEALMQWREELDDESELTFARADRGNDAVFEFSVKGDKCDPFAKDAIINYEKPIRTMYDRLLSGIGTELRYSYRKGVNRITLRLPKSDVRNTLFRRLALSSFVPFALQALIINIASNIGIIILGFLSSEAMSGVSFASQIVLIHSMLISAATSSVNSVLSQLWGKRKGSSAIYAMTVTVIFSTAICFLEFVVCFFFPEKMLGLYTNLPELIREGAAYLKIASIGFLFNSFCNVFYAFLRVTNQGKIVTNIVLTGCIVNFALNLLLVFGFLGLPQLGAAGSGIAMAAGVLVQFVLCYAYYRKIKPSFYNASDEIDKSHIIRVIFKNAVPIFLQVSIYLVGSNFVAAAIGHINADVIAAYSFVNAINAYLTCTKNACQDTSGILSGLQLGRNHFEEARAEHSILCRYAVYVGLVSVAALFAIVFLGQFLPVALDAAAKQYLLPITLAFAVNDMFGLQNVTNNAALYAGGQARTIFLIDGVNSLLLALPLALLSMKLNCFAPVLLVFLAKMDEAVTFFPKMLAAKKGKWLQNIVE